MLLKQPVGLEGIQLGIQSDFVPCHHGFSFVRQPFTDIWTFGVLLDDKPKLLIVYKSLLLLFEQVWVRAFTDALYPL